LHKLVQVKTRQATGKAQYSIAESRLNPPRTATKMWVIFQARLKIGHGISLGSRKMIGLRLGDFLRDNWINAWKSKDRV
jgi:hypothetical protein